jgi:hypothetical protein
MAFTTAPQQAYQPHQAAFNPPVSAESSETPSEKLNLFRVLLGKIAEDYAKDPASWKESKDNMGYQQFTKNGVILNRYVKFGYNREADRDSWTVLGLSYYDENSSALFSERMQEVYRTVENKIIENQLTELIGRIDTAEVTE